MPRTWTTAANGAHIIDFRSTDLDETRFLIRSAFGDHSRTFRGTGRFLYSMTGVSTGGVTMGRILTAPGQVVRATLSHPTLSLPGASGDTVWHGRRPFRPDATQALISAAGHDYTRDTRVSDNLALQVDKDLLDQEIAARARGRARRWIVQSISVPMPAERHGELFAFFAQMQGAARPEGSWGAYDSRAGFERAVAGWMAELLLDAAGVRAATQLSLHRLARLERWVDEHLAEDITLDQLCSVAGVGWRALQKMLLCARGQTPMEFVQSRRLAAARKRFEAGPASVRVSVVALDCGFRHLGRFSASYHAAFGELPTETVRASVRCDG